MDNHRTQCERILSLLKFYAPSAVPLHFILDLRIASHTRRIHELRKAGHVIEMTEQRIDGQRRTAYRLIEVRP